MGPNYAQIVMKATAVDRGGGVKPINNVYNFKRTTAVNPRVKANVEAAFQAAIGVPVLAALSVDYTQTENTVRWLDDADDSPISFTEANVGGQAGERYETFTAAYVLLKTSVRKTRGSKHYGPIAEADINGDQLTVAAKARFDTVAAAILAGFTDSDGNVWQSTIVNTKNAIFGVNPTLFGDGPVTAAVARKTVGTMRRRQVRGVY